MLPPGGNFAENNRFWKVLTWIGSELNANSMQPWIDLKEKLLFSSDCEQCLCPKATPKGRNILSAHEAHQPLWRHRRCCLWQGEDFDGGDSEGRVMMILATHWSNWGWFWLHGWIRHDGDQKPKLFRWLLPSRMMIRRQCHDHFGDFFH